jgi:hypothetical protein
VPLIMTHGWPGSFFEFDRVLGPLTDPLTAAMLTMCSMWLCRRFLATGSAASQPAGLGHPRHRPRLGSPRVVNYPGVACPDPDPLAGIDCRAPEARWA